MNGLRLEKSDYNASSTTVTLGSGAAVGDEVTITAFLTFESADHYTKSAADTRYVNATGDTVSGDLTVSGNEFKAGQHVGNITNFSSGHDFAQFGYNTIMPHRKKVSSPKCINRGGGRMLWPEKLFSLSLSL